MIAVMSELESILNNSRYSETASYTQHGQTSCMLHTIAVAYYSDRVFKRLKIACHRRELIRGALLHDYFLYDWHDKRPERKIHGFTHANTALKNANRDFLLSDVERNIIARHMFPLTPVPPKVREAWVVCAVDKVCSVYEVFSKQPYKTIRSYLIKKNIGV